MKYTTEQGDTFDLVASKTLGSEVLMDRVIDANPDMAGVLIFGTGVVLNIPEAEEVDHVTLKSAPPWRKRQ